MCNCILHPLNPAVLQALGMDRTHCCSSRGGEGGLKKTGPDIIRRRAILSTLLREGKYRLGFTLLGTFFFVWFCVCSFVAAVSPTASL